MKNLKMVELHSNDLQSFLKNFDATNLYPNYICKRAPKAFATVYQLHEIEGALIDGPGNKIFESCAQWIITKETEAAKYLLNQALKSGKKWDIEIPHNIIPRSELAELPIHIGKDFLMEMNWANFPNITAPENIEIRELHRESNLQEYVDAWVVERTGPLCDWTPESPLYVVVSDKKIVACCEALVRDSSRASIGQLSTRENFRGRGYAKALVHHFCRFLREKNLTPYYLVASDNTSSLNLASSIGFQTVSEFDCITPNR
jgi:ribosomal protein S18 acetylase RimI-like enzyme